MRFRTLRLILLLVAAAAVAAAATTCGGHAPHAARYHCPMHPTYIAEKPGDCPICGMRLVPIEWEAAPAPAATYSCPMHPEVTSDEPGRCPKCGMDLVAMAPTSARESVPQIAMRADHTAESPAPPPGERKPLYYRSPMDPTVTSPVPMKDAMGMDYVPVYAHEEGAQARRDLPGHVAVALDAEGIRLANVQTVSAVREPLARTIRTVGTVTADETRIRHVHTKIPGWVEKLFVNYTGQLVRQGEPILTIYSRELLASQEEFLRAREVAARFSASELPEVREGGADLVRAARRRLELFDVPEAFIARLESSGDVQRSVTLEAPVSGFVTVKDVFEGQQVEPSMELFTIADLTRVWVEADFYESEAAALRLGTEAVVVPAYDAAASLRGRVAFVSPTVTADTRTLKVRFEFPNPAMALRPGMFANVALAAEAVDGIVVPDSALMDTGERQIVFVATGDGVFAPRVVRVGVRAGGKAQILAGVAAGEEVVVRANFLLDSESRLRAAIAGTAAGGHGGHR